MPPRPLLQVISDVFSLDGEELRDDMGPDDIVLWDSLGHLALVTRLEEEYSVRLAMDDVLALKTIGQIRDVLRRHQVSTL